MTRRLVPILLTAGALVAFKAPTTFATTLATGEDIIGRHDASKIVVVEDVRLKGGAVTGKLQNKGTHLVRDTRLLLNFVWFWKNEKHPGTDNPGRSEYVTIKDDIPIGEYINFTYQPSPPLPDRGDGYFKPQVNIVGFSEVGD